MLEIGIGSALNLPYYRAPLRVVEQQILVFRWDGKELTEGTPLPIKGGPAAIMTPWP